MSNTPQPPDPIDEILPIIERAIVDGGRYVLHKTDPINSVRAGIDLPVYDAPKALTDIKAKINALMIPRKEVEAAIPPAKELPEENVTGHAFARGYDQAISDIRSALGMDK